jgi:hydroxypyruvate isomerase
MVSMDRRSFVQATVVAGATMAAKAGAVSAAAAEAAGAATDAGGALEALSEGAVRSPMPVDSPAPAGGRARFKLKYAPNFGTFVQHVGSRDNWVGHLEFMASEGFTALEYNGMRGRTPQEQELIGRTLERLGMTMGVFVAHTIDWANPGAPNLPSADREKTETFLREIRESVDVAKRCNAKWMTVVPGSVDGRLDPGYQTANVISALRRAAEILEPHGLVMVLEMLNTRTNHPWQFLTTTAQAYSICKAVNSPSCKILYDIYHQQITEGNLIPNMNRSWDEIAYMQVGDNPGRNEPGTGEINYRNIFRHIHSRGFTGVLGMEHGQSIRGGNALPEAERNAVNRRGERAVIDAYRAADDFQAD